MAHAADATRPHEHRGIVTPYSGAPPALALTAAERARLDAGEMLLKQTERGAGAHAVAVEDIRATPERIWSRITNYPRYPEWVSGVKRCTIYARGGDHILVEFGLSVMGVKVDYFVDHHFVPAENYLTWTLDYSRQSDLDDSVGYWRLTPLRAEPPLTRLEYTVDVRLKGWIPAFVQDFLTKRGLTDAVGWVKTQSEAG